MKRLALLAALFLAAPSFAQDFTPSVTGDGVKAVIVVSKLPFSVVAPAGAAVYIWTAPAGVVFTENEEKIDVTAAPPGELVFAVKTVTVDFDAKKIVKKSGRVVVTVGGVKPPDPPMPTQKVAHVVVVEESAQRTLADGRIIGDLQGWKALGVSHFVMDKDDPQAISLGYTSAAAKAGGLPAMVLLAEGGKFLRAVRLPATFAEVRAEVLK